MRLKKILLGLVVGAAITAGTALVPTRQAVADEGFDCFATRTAGANCGCPDCIWNNCTCPKYPTPPRDEEGGGDSEWAN
jgi:hypothetical protein